MGDLYAGKADVALTWVLVAPWQVILTVIPSTTRRWWLTFRSASLLPSFLSSPALVLTHEQYDRSPVYAVWVSGRL